MFQPQPTPFASSVFASPFAFQPASAPPPASASPPAINNSSSSNLNQSRNHHLDPNPHQPVFSPSPSSPLPYGIGSHIPFGYYFNPVALGGGGGGSGLAAELVGVGSGSGSRAEAGARIAGPGATARGASKGPTPTASTKFAYAAPRGLICDDSLYTNSQEFNANASVTSRQAPTRDHRQHTHARSQPQPRQQRRSTPIKMEDQQDPHGMAAQQAAAQDYQPDLPVS